MTVALAALLLLLSLLLLVLLLLPPIHHRRLLSSSFFFFPLNRREKSSSFGERRGEEGCAGFFVDAVGREEKGKERVLNLLLHFAVEVSVTGYSTTDATVMKMDWSRRQKKPA